MNISGAGVVAHSPHPKEARAFLEWLLSPEAQKLFAELNDEYPVIRTVESSTLLKSWGSFEPESLSLAEVGRYQKKAVSLMDRVRYRLNLSKNFSLKKVFLQGFFALVFFFPFAGSDSLSFRKYGTGFCPFF